MTLEGNETIRAFMDKLTTATQVGDYIDLPMIAVMGDTSSGKSSLLSSISMVELPSAANLTTRCPIRLQMQNAEERSAKVSVHWKNQPTTNGNNGRNIDFAPKVVDEENWHELSEFISQAQAHIIAVTGNEVATDIVQVEIAGPGCENLTLVDLPGIVRTVGRGEGANLGDDINDLIQVYLKNSRCIILAVVPANVDFHNSQIMNEASLVDPKTERTIPVITKPDLIDRGGEQDVLDLLEGRKTNRFHYGFHMIKNRGQAALNQMDSIEDGLQAEEHFFAMEEPWSSVEDRSLFGTAELRRKLGELQLRLVGTSLPAIMEEINKKRDQAVSELDGMGSQHKSLGEKRLFFNTLRNEIVRYLKFDLGDSSSYFSPKKGTRQPEKLASAEFHRCCENFQTTLKKGRLSDFSSISVGSEVVTTIDNEDIEGVVVAKADDEYVYIDYEGRQSVDISQLCPKSKIKDKTDVDLFTDEGFTWITKGYCCISNGDGTYDQLAKYPISRVRLDMDWLTDMINDRRGDELPIFPNSGIFKSLVARFIEEDWSGPCHSLVDDMSNLLNRAVDNALASTDKSSRYQSLRRLLKERCGAAVKETVESVTTDVKEFIARSETPYTQDHYLFENLAKKNNGQLLKELFEALGLSGSINDSNLSSISVKKTIEAVFDKNQKKPIGVHMTEMMEHALEAYGKVVLKRFIDEVPSICWNMIREFPSAIDEKLISSVTDEELMKRMADSSSFTRKYDRLQREAKDLQEGLDILNELHIELS